MSLIQKEKKNTPNIFENIQFSYHTPQCISIMVGYQKHVQG